MLSFEQGDVVRIPRNLLRRVLETIIWSLAAAAEATVLESAGWSRTDMDRSGRASRPILCRCAQAARRA
jgi:hypothetical protein